MSKASEREAAFEPNATARIGDCFDNMDFRYLNLALEVGADKGWDFQLADIRRVEAMWRLLDGDATSYGFIVELRDGRRVYFDYDNYDQDGIVEHVTLQPMGDESYPKRDSSFPDWERASAPLNRRFAN
jgi:hypothetical protein